MTRRWCAGGRSPGGMWPAEWNVAHATEVADRVARRGAGGSDIVTDPMSDPVSEELGRPPVVEADERAAQRLAAAKPEVDRYVREVMRARVASELFGEGPEVTVGRYQLRRQVGRGGGGSVFVAWDPELTREVALKLIVAADPALRARALAEGQALARLSHPNVVPAFDVGVVEERGCLV